MYLVFKPPNAGAVPPLVNDPEAIENEPRRPRRRGPNRPRQPRVPVGESGSDYVPPRQRSGSRNRPIEGTVDAPPDQAINGHLNDQPGQVQPEQRNETIAPDGGEEAAGARNGQNGQPGDVQREPIDPNDGVAITTIREPDQLVEIDLEGEVPPFELLFDQPQPALPPAGPQVPPVDPVEPPEQIGEAPIELQGRAVHGEPTAAPQNIQAVYVRY